MRCSTPTSWAPSSWAARRLSPILTTCACRRTAAGGFEPPASDDINEAGQAATAAEALSVRRFGPADEIDTLRRFQRALPERLPQRRGYRRIAARRGPGLDLRRAMQGADPQRRRDLPPAAPEPPACAAAPSCCSSTSRAR